MLGHLRTQDSRERLELDQADPRILPRAGADCVQTGPSSRFQRQAKFSPAGQMKAETLLPGQTQNLERRIQPGGAPGRGLIALGKIGDVAASRRRRSEGRLS
jgi:hypothetical protein